jgi:hypothetical protein
MRNVCGELRYSDFNAFLQVNRALYSCLNPDLWQAASQNCEASEAVFTHLLNTNNLAGLKRFLELGANVDTRLDDFDENENDDDEVIHEDMCELWSPTPLVVAAYRDNLAMADLLLQYDAEVVQYDWNGTPFYGALHAACSAEMVQLLLDHGADPNETVIQGPCRFTPLHCYARRGNIEAMWLLLENGAEVDPMGLFWMPLHDAASTGSIDTVTLLLEYGANAAASTRTGDRPLHLAADTGMIDIVKLLLEYWDEAIGEKDLLEYTPLHRAALAGSVDVVRHLVELWPEGKSNLGDQRRNPLMLFEEYVMPLVDDATTKEMLCLLSPAGIE